MQTISSNKSLIPWNRNTNKSDIYVSALGGDELFIKPYMERVFSYMAGVFKAGPTKSFVETWLKAVDSVSASLESELTDRVQKSLPAISKADLQASVDRVTTKFKGNVGEIMVEMLAENGILNFIKPGSYTTVDPDHEQFVDAEAVRDGLPIGIQIKNYSHKKVEREVLTKAAAMSDLWLRRDKRIRDEDVLDFIKTPCQYVISTADVSSDLLLEDYKNSVVILGPKWLDSQKIQGSVKSGEAAMWRMFKAAADEIGSYMMPL